MYCVFIHLVNTGEHSEFLLCVHRTGEVIRFTCETKLYISSVHDTRQEAEVARSDLAQIFATAIEQNREIILPPFPDLYAVLAVKTSTAGGVGDFDRRLLQGRFIYELRAYQDLVLLLITTDLEQARVVYEDPVAQVEEAYRQDRLRATAERFMPNHRVDTGEA